MNALTFLRGAILRLVAGVGMVNGLSIAVDRRMGESLEVVSLDGCVRHGVVCYLKGTIHTEM